MKENKMGVMPISKLIVSMSLPMIISMLVQALYNIVDSIFVARISEDALTAVSLVFPIQTLMIAVSGGTGVGVNALLSKRLGEGKKEEAGDVARHGIFLSLIGCLVFALLGIAGSRYFFLAQTNNARIIEYGTDYMTIITVFSVGIFMQITFERLLQSTGKTIYNMITQGIGAIINIVLDPILIFGWFGFPRMEVVGAAVATVTGQIVAVILGLIFNVKCNKEININMRKFRPNKRIVGGIYKVGIPSIIMQSIGSVMTFSMNKIIIPFSTTAAAVFGVYFKLQSFAFMPVFGLTNGLIPIIAYNYGARNKKRILSTIKRGIVIAVGIMVVGFAAFQLIPEQLLQMFDASVDMIDIGVPALQAISYSFLVAGFAIVASCSFQALGNGMYSLIVSAVRQLVVLVPVAFIFSRMFGLNMVWWSFPIAEISSLVLCIVFLRRIFKQKLRGM